MGRECEAVEIMALCAAMQIGVAIEYLDGAPLDKGRLSCPIFPEGAEPQITLLYRPGAKAGRAGREGRRKEV